MTATRQRVYLDFDGLATISISKDAPTDVVRRYLNEEWASAHYSFDGDDGVYEHWVYNAIVNGITDIAELDGWADVPPGTVQIDLSNIHANL